MEPPSAQQCELPHVGRRGDSAVFVMGVTVRIIPASCHLPTCEISFCPMARQPALARREREIMDVVYRLGGATSRQIREELQDPPHPAAVRTLLRILETKGQLRHTKDGPRHVYVPTTPRSVAQRSAVKHLLSTFFGGSRAAAVAALLDDGDQPLTSSEHDALATAVKRLRAEGR